MYPNDSGMRSPDSRPAQPAPQLPEPVSLPAVVEDDRNTVKVKRDEKGILYVQVESAETVIFSAAVTPEQKVRLLFDVQTHPEPLSHPTDLLTQPHLFEPPPPELTNGEEHHETDTPVWL